MNKVIRTFSRILEKYVWKNSFLEKFERTSFTEYLQNTGKYGPEKTPYLDTLYAVVFSGLRQFLARESPLKMMGNTFYFTLKALFVFKMFKVLS